MASCSIIRASRSFSVTTSGLRIDKVQLIMSHADGSSAGNGIDIPEPHRKSIGAEVALATRGSKSSMIIALEDIIFEGDWPSGTLTRHETPQPWGGLWPRLLISLASPTQRGTLSGMVHERSLKAGHPLSHASMCKVHICALENSCRTHRR